MIDMGNEERPSDRQVQLVSVDVPEVCCIRGCDREAVLLIVKPYVPSVGDRITIGVFCSDHAVLGEY